MNDPRFDSYHERRYTHLIKLAMVLCALRGYTCIDKADYQEAHRILRATEKGMPDALGQFGMNPLAALKQGIVDHVRSAAFITLEEFEQSFTGTHVPKNLRRRSEEHTSELQSLMRRSYAVF